MDVKKIFRIVGLVVLTYSLSTCLLLIANAAVFTFHTSSPERMKSTIKDSGVYEKAPEIIYAEITANPENKNSSINLSDPAIKSAALEAFNPEFLQANTESFIAGGYNWLEGKSENLNFEINLEPAKKDFVNNVVDTQAKLIAELPECTVEQLQKLQSSAVDIFSLECLPPGINIKQEAENAKKEILNDKNFIAQTKFGSNDIKDDKGVPLTESLPNMQTQFAAIKLLPIMFSVLALGFFTAIYFVSRPAKKALPLLGKIFIVAGIFVLIAPFAIGLFTQAIIEAEPTKTVASQLVEPVIKQFNKATAYIYYIFAAIFIGLGILQIFAQRYLNSREKTTKKSTKRKKDKK